MSLHPTTSYPRRCPDCSVCVVICILIFAIRSFVRLFTLILFIITWLACFVFSQFLAIAGKFMRIFNLICLMLLCGHWNGCLQFLVPLIQEFPKDCWVSAMGLEVRNRRCYLHCGLELARIAAWASSKITKEKISVLFGRR